MGMVKPYFCEMKIMDGLPKNEGDLPKINIADFINQTTELDCHAEKPVGTKGKEVKSREFHGLIDGYEDDTNRYIHHIISVTSGVKLYTQAVLDRTDFGERRFLNSPDLVEFYEMWIAHYDEKEKIFLNTVKPELALEIHTGFFEDLMKRQSLRETTEWLQFQSKYAAMKSEKDVTVAFVDHMPAAARKKLRGIR